MTGNHYVTAKDALACIESGNRVFIHGSAATPVYLVQQLISMHHRLQGVELVSITNMGNLDFTTPEFRKSFYFNSLFVSDNTRAIVNCCSGDYVPVFLSQIPQLFREAILSIDVALVQVSPPDKHGYCSLGTSVDIARAAVDTAKIVIAQVNEYMPRTHGDGFVHSSRFNYMVWEPSALPELDYAKQLTPAIIEIGKKVASIVEDGATLQLGIGSIPDQVLINLRNHRHLGLHSEMFSDGVIDLLEKGIIDNSRKKICAGKSVTSFLAGTKKLYDYVDDHPMISLKDISWVNDPGVIRQNPKVTAINCAIEIDLTGQICADSIGTFQYSGIGGQMDFMHGASMSEGGKPIIAMPSVTAKNVSRIVPTLKPGAGVVTTRGHIHWVVTEYGKVNLFGKSLKQRARELIGIAHPDHRDILEKAYRERFDKPVAEQLQKPATMITTDHNQPPILHSS